MYHTNILYRDLISGDFVELEEEPVRAELLRLTCMYIMDSGRWAACRMTAWRMAVLVGDLSKSEGRFVLRIVIVSSLLYYYYL